MVTFNFMDLFVAVCFSSAGWEKNAHMVYFFRGVFALSHFGAVEVVASARSSEKLS